MGCLPLGLPTSHHATRLYPFSLRFQMPPVHEVTPGGRVSLVKVASISGWRALPCFSRGWVWSPPTSEKEELVVSESFGRKDVEMLRDNLLWNLAKSSFATGERSKNITTRFFSKWTAQALTGPQLSSAQMGDGLDGALSEER